MYLGSSTHRIQLSQSCTESLVNYNDHYHIRKYFLKFYNELCNQRYLNRTAEQWVVFQCADIEWVDENASIHHLQNVAHKLLPDVVHRDHNLSNTDSNHPPVFIILFRDMTIFALLVVFANIIGLKFPICDVS